MARETECSMIMQNRNSTFCICSATKCKLSAALALSIDDAIFLSHSTILLFLDAVACLLPVHPNNTIFQKLQMTHSLHGSHLDHHHKLHHRESVLLTDPLRRNSCQTERGTECIVFMNVVLEQQRSIGSIDGRCFPCKMFFRSMFIAKLFSAPFCQLSSTTSTASNFRWFWI